MSAVWPVSRAAVRRRRMQTVIIGVVVMLSTSMIVVALGLLAASSGPFDQAYARQSGAHLVASYDRTKVSDAQLTESARTAAAVAGPFGQATLDMDTGGPETSLVVVGRADPGGTVDRLNVWKGRWATKPGEIVMNRNPTDSTGRGAPTLGETVTVAGSHRLTIVGFAYSVSGSADAWVAPAQMTSLKPTSTQMLYRFAQAATNEQVSAGQSAVTSGLPSGALVGTQSYLALRALATGEPNTFVPFLMVFGWLGLAVAVLIVANVVSGAVVAGFKHIGVLKALGFTPTQVMTVYLAMVSIPAFAGCAIGTVLGNVLAESLLTRAFENYGAGGVGVAVWVDVAALLGVPALVALSALVPALRARSLSAAEAISAGSAPRAGRGLRAQRWLSGTRLPRAVSLGFGLPFARPARTALTLAAVVLGVTSVTLAVGLGKSLTSYQTAASRVGAVDVTMFGGLKGSGPPPPGEVAPPVAKLTDAQDEALLRSTPGASAVIASAELPMRLAGTNTDLRVSFYRGDFEQLGYRMLSGRWFDGPGQVVVSERFLRQHGLAIGDTITLQSEGRNVQARIVGKALYNSGEEVLSNWQTLALVAPELRASLYEIKVKPGTDLDSYVKAVQAGDSGLQEASGQESGSFVAIVLATVVLLTLMLGTVAALGVFNTVVLNTRERRRDLGMLKSIGMTPAQVVVMVVTSMAALGAIGGLLGIPLGIVAHRLVVPAMANGAQVAIPDFMLHVYPAPLLALLVLAGIAISALGAFVPARSAAHTTIAEVLHNE
ncbi:putative ABC transport system permease protein [Kribbella voronezhensis]|uniref:Putative ABC transport system permease protein n=1 Tax=Kribbella voronezhensis TaxID=2512212 RepID=A0A4R7THN9_9ACTN|nr:ABC transporter permease [Kribbella voronezhensis]TDU91007.1 putative ABC transport system permease protein [Kribbella voronezhensis]